MSYRRIITVPTAMQLARFGLRSFFLALCVKDNGRDLRHERHPRAFGRTPPETRLRRISFGILFKMPITTTKLSKNYDSPAMDEAIADRIRVPIPEE